MTITIILLIAVIAAALVFEYINGFHDCANAIATVVSTRVLTPKQAVLFGAGLEFVGALLGTHVAKTIGAGIVNPDFVTLKVILFALLAAITWNLITWYFGLPSSSSHALIGGLIGSSVVHAGFGVVQVHGVVEKVIKPMFITPVLGFFCGFCIMLLLLRLFYKANPEKVNKHFRKLQLLSAGTVALTHGMNDAQKTMGIISLALLTGGVISRGSDGGFEIPIYVIIVCAITMSLGVMSGGWKIIKTMGHKIIRLKPINGFAAEFSAASIIFIASNLGIPLSTTHLVSTSIMGVGATMRASAVNWGIIGNIVWAWVLTIPICMGLAALLYWVANSIFHLTM